MGEGGGAWCLFGKSVSGKFLQVIFGCLASFGYFCLCQVVTVGVLWKVVWCITVLHVVLIVCCLAHHAAYDTYIHVIEFFGFYVFPSRVISDHCNIVGL